MTARLKRDIKALLFYLLVFLITYSVVGVILELAWMPFIAWMHDYPGYFWPSKARIYAWCKLVPFATLVSGVGVWLYERRRIGW
jgi:hypothetical protein